MRVIAQKMLREFWEKNPQSEQPLKAWYQEAVQCDWTTPQDIKYMYRSADFLKDNRVVFNICGNKYRLIVKINYDKGIVFTRFVGTHAHYDKINAEKV